MPIGGTGPAGGGMIIPAALLNAANASTGNNSASGSGYINPTNLGNSPLGFKSSTDAFNGTFSPNYDTTDFGVTTTVAEKKTAAASNSKINLNHNNDSAANMTGSIGAAIITASKDSPVVASSGTGNNTAETDPQVSDSRLDVKRIYLGAPDDANPLPKVYHALSNQQEESFINNYYTADSEELANIAKKSDASSKAAIEQFSAGRKAYENNSNFRGVPSLMNNYSITKLYGYGINATSFRDYANMPRYYEVDDISMYNTNHYSKFPRTSAIIKICNEDLYGRTPYKFADFCFCKWWNKIPNNRMITLRRYSAPTYDNLNFPGMEEEYKHQQGANEENGKFSGKAYTPFATAVTYFGDETGNTLKNLLSFSSGMRWAEASTSIWDVQGEQQDLSETGIKGSGGISKAVHGTILGLGTLANVLSKDPNKAINPDALFMKGLPDPFVNGPYENLIIGPVNVIDKTYKRERGLDFTQDINVTFEYVSRPIDNLNCKAVLLDVLSNVLALGTASGMFFGGGHRFNVTPALNPFQNTAARSKWYEGRLLGKDGAVRETVENTQDRYNDVGGLKGALSSLLSGAGDIFKTLIGDVVGPLSGKGEASSSTSSDTGPQLTRRVGALFANALNMGTTTRYMSGMKALLTGDPVGEWHMIIGNPLNPIAMIGNLICEKVAIEFTDELGEDDFPIGFKAVFTLKHGMPRDMDAIESMFNRGQGRIYELPDKLKLSSASQSQIDNATKTIQKATGEYTTATANKLQMQINGGVITKGKAQYSTKKLVNTDAFEIGDYFKDPCVNGLSAISGGLIEGLASVKNNENIVMLEAWTANKILG